MRDNIMITFANQKGGVGKTTLCTMFADYLAAKGESLLVVDFDRQQTIYSKRKEDVEKYRGVRIADFIRKRQMRKSRHSIQTVW